jgi:hypothetical protein
MASTKNTAKSTATTKVCAHKLSECLAQWEVIQEAEATRLGAWFAIGTIILSENKRGLQAEFVERTGANKGDVSSAVKVAFAHAESLANDDDGFDWEDYTSLQDASNAARAYLKGDEVPVKKSRKSADTTEDMTPEEFLKAKGAKAAMKFALEVMALASK